MKHIIADERLRQQALVGNKFAQQKRMAERGIPVPPFFCLSAELYDEVFAPLRGPVREVLARVDFDQDASLRKACEDIQLRFEAIEFSPARERAILCAFDAHFGVGGVVSVRSATLGGRAEESEDSLENPFAGMADSFLYIRRGAILDKIRQCWASGFSPRSVLYRRWHGIDPCSFSIAVGIQEMVAGERSFVMFTCEPNTGAPTTLVAAGYGIGAGVVQEKVAVDHYFICAKGGVFRREVALKTESLGSDGRADGQLVTSPVPVELQGAPCLSDAELIELTTLGRRIEELFGHPQDIEGTFSADGRVHVLQARPIAFDVRRRSIWSNANITESFPGTSTALTYSFARTFYRIIFYDLYRRFGVSADALNNHHEQLDRMVGYIGGRLYYCVSNWYTLHGLIALFPLFREPWEKMMGLPAQPAWGRAGVEAPLLQMCRRVWPLLRLAGQFGTHERNMREFGSWWSELIRPLRGPLPEDELVLVSTLQRVLREVGNHWGLTLINDAFLILVSKVVASCLARWMPAAPPGLHSDLLCGGDENVSVSIMLSVARFAERARESPTLLEALERRSSREVWAALEAGEFEAGLRDALREHVSRYGDRGLRELELAQPSLRDTPWLLLEMTREYVRRGVTAAGLQASEEEARARAEIQLEHALQARWRRLILEQLLAVQRRLILHRENSRYMRSELFGFVKRCFRKLGEQLAARGALARPEDVFHLTQHEVIGYVDGTGVTEDLRALAELRRAELSELERSEPPMYFTALGRVRNRVTTEPSADRHEGAVLRGLGSSSGLVRGRACVVRDPLASPPPAAGSILVARETDPGWLFLMLASKGIVVERGTMLSHTAITGRKLGIPTVVAVPDAMRRIPDGAWIEIDGATGVVKILEQAA